MFYPHLIVSNVSKISNDITTNNVITYSSTPSQFMSSLIDLKENGDFLDSFITVAKMTPTEVLVHEVGHNLASSFVHKYTTKELAEGANDGTYEYNQVGLQSNENKKIYPTLLDNTIQIINDTFNRKNMTIL